MLRIQKIAVVIVALMFGTSAFAGGDAKAGKSKAAACAGCHGAKGISSSPMWPNLAGQKEAYLAKQIKDFKSGVRKDATMAPMVASLTDADIANLAAYYAGLK